MGRDKAYPDRNYEVGRRLLGLRTRTKLTQAQLATRVGVSTRSVEKWETGEVYPSEERVRKLLEVLLSEGAFLAGKEQDEAQAFWELVSQIAPRRLSAFDENWFNQLLSSSTNLISSNSTATTPSTAQTSAEPEALGSNTTQPISLASSSAHVADWGEAISVGNFYGRQSERAELENWLTSAQRCRVVTLLGMGGIGKTTLSIKVSQQLTAHFDYILWRSLRSAPPFSEILATALYVFSDQTITTPPVNSNEGITQLIQLMRQHRCLLILDNLETLLQEDVEAGSYREGYAEYGVLVRRMAESDHQSRLVLTSREKPRELGAFEGYDSPVRTMRLSGLGLTEFQEILSDRGLAGTRAEWLELTARYGGNPLALKLVSETVRETFGGSIRNFLAADAVLFGDVRYLLDSQFERLTELERDVMFWLAIEREPVGLVTLEGNLSVPSPSRRSLLEALESLRRRNLIERSESGNELTLQPVVMEYVTERLIEHVFAEFVNVKSPNSGNQPYQFLAKYALMKAQTRDYVRQSQQRMIVQPLLVRLKGQQNDPSRVESYFRQTLERVRDLPSDQQGYAGGNILNLLVELGADLQGWDFSGLQVWQAYLAGVELRDVNMAGSDLSRSTFTEGFDSILALAYSPGGQFLAGGSMAGDIKIWQLQEQPADHSYSLRLDLQGHTDMVSSVAYSSDGRFLASGSYDRTVRLWDVESGDNLLVLQGHADSIRSVAFSPDGRFLASGSLDGSIKLWRVATGGLLTTLEGKAGWVWSVAFSPDGRLLASGSFDGTLRLWEINLPANTYQPLAALDGHQNSVTGLVFSPDGHTLYSCGVDSTIRQWSIASQTQLQIWEGHSGAIQAIALSPDGTTLASAGVDRIIQLWKTESDKPYLSLSGHTAPIVALAFSPDGNSFASSSADRSVRLWSTSPGEGLATLQGYSNLVTALAVSSKGNYLVSNGRNNRVLIWQLTNQVLQAPYQVTPSLVLKGHTNQILTVTFSLTGMRLACAGQDATIKLWDIIQAGERTLAQARLTLNGHTDNINALAFSPVAPLLASGSGDGTIRLWSTVNGEPITVLEGHQAIVRTVAFSPDGNSLVSGGNDGTIRLWDTGSEQLKASLGSDKIPIANLAYHSSGRFLACARFDGTIQLWEMSNKNQPMLLLNGHQGTVWSVAFNPDSAAPPILLSGGNDGTVRLWNIESGQELTRFQHEGYVRSVAFTPDGASIVSAGDGGLIKLWDIASGQLGATYRDFQPYEGVNISGTTGLTAAQRAALLALGALEN